MDLDRRDLFNVTAGVAMLSAFSAEAQEGQRRDTGKGAKAPPPLKGLVRKGYIDTTTGQLHYYVTAPEKDTGKTPVVFFHPNPYSGLYFSYMLEALGTDRVVMAFDTPGYGGSTRPKEPQSMEQLAATMAKALENLGYGEGKKGKVDVSGFHTGCYISTEVAVSRPDLVRRMVQIGVPFWEGEVLEKQRKTLLQDKALTEDAEHAMAEWKFAVTSRNPLIPIERAYDLFVQACISGRQIWWAYNAVINYNARARFQAVIQPTLLLTPQGGLSSETKAVLPLLKKGKLVDVPDLTHGIYDVGFDILAKHFRDYLDAPV